MSMRLHPHNIPCYHLLPRAMESHPLTPKPARKSLVTSLVDAFTLPRATSFKEDTYFASQLSPTQEKALHDLKRLLSTTPPQPNSPPLRIWGVGLLDEGDERANVVLLKFLRARDFHVAHAQSMLLRCLEWRTDYGADGLTGEDVGMGEEIEGVVACMRGVDREGRPVCYNAYGVLRDRGVSERVLGDEEKVRRFLRWRVQVMERGVGLLQFKPGGINSIVQVMDLKGMMTGGELRVVTNQMLSLFPDNYPELVARTVFVNVPWYFSTLYSMLSPFLTRRTKSKFVIAKEGRVAETLYKFIRPEYVPIQYGGLSRHGDIENGPPKPASEFTIKGGEKVNLEVDGIEDGATITWEIVVGGWEVEYKAEYIPSDEQSYTVLVEKPTRMFSTYEPVKSTYTAKELGKLVLSIDNTASRRRKVAAYRYHVRKSFMYKRREPDGVHTQN